MQAAVRVSTSNFAGIRIYIQTMGDYDVVKTSLCMPEDT